jgi:peptidyl-prolyl cis-trans isomerase C
MKTLLFPLKITLFFTLLFLLFFYTTSTIASEDDIILARAGETVLTVGEFKKYLAQISRRSRVPIRDPEKRRQFLEFLVDNKLLALEARKEGLDKKPEIKAKIREATDRILADEYVRKRIPRDIQITNDEVKAYYNKNIEKFTREARVMLRQIVLKSNDEAEAILAELKEGGDFEKLAKEKSIDLTAKSGGLVGWLRKGKVPRAVEKIAYTMKKDETSGIISSEGKYYILKVENRQEAKVIPFEQSKRMVKSRATTDKRKRMLEDFRAKLREKYNVEINTEAVKEVIGK